MQCVTFPEPGLNFRELTVKQGLEEGRLQLQNSIESSLSQLQQKEGELSSWRVKVGFHSIPFSR